MKTLIVLIDFYGHPDLTTDRYSDSVRYSYLTEIILAHRAPDGISGGGRGRS